MLGKTAKSNTYGRICALRSRSVCLRPFWRKWRTSRNLCQVYQQEAQQFKYQTLENDTPRSHQRTLADSDAHCQVPNIQVCPIPRRLWFCCHQSSLRTSVSPSVVQMKTLEQPGLLLATTHACEFCGDQISAGLGLYRLQCHSMSSHLLST
jgi:hypothetical protein